MTSLAAFALAAQTALAPAPLPTPQHLAVLQVRAPKALLRLQVASTQAQRERGLMSVTHLQPHAGMLFVFDNDAPVAFWMKDTLISLDMVFLGSNGIVRAVFPKVPVVSPQLADAEIPLEQGSAKYVIELAAGEAATDGLTVGARVRGLP